MSKALVRISVPEAAPQAIQAAPQPTPAKTQALLPFSTYYGTHLRPKGCLDAVHARFPALKTAPASKAVASFGSYYVKHFQPLAGLEATHSRFPVSEWKRDSIAKSEPRAAATPKAVASFGSYYIKHFKPRAGLEALHSRFPAPKASKQSKPAAAVQVQPARPFTTRPSVGTWLKEVPKAADSGAPQAPVKVKTLTPFGPYYNSNLTPEGGFDAAHARFNVSKPEVRAVPQRKAATPESPAKAEAPFKYRASVGTWLLPKKVTGDGSGLADIASSPADAAFVQADSDACPADVCISSFEMQPSVGTWLCSLPQERPKKQDKQDKCPKAPGMLSTQVLMGPSFFSMGLQPSVSFF